MNGLNLAIKVEMKTKKKTFKFTGTLKYINTLRTGAFKLFKCTFPGSKQFKSTFIMCFFKYL